MENGKTPSTGGLLTRATSGGVLMGLANLVPGISGGTMLLAAGIYPEFIDAVASVTRLRFRLRSLLVLVCVAAAAFLSIVMFAGVLKGMVISHRWVMYSLFIGLTLGGVPVVWKLARPGSPALFTAATVAFASMVGLAVAQANGVVGNSGQNVVMLFVAGLAGASAMILPGLSGGYLLLLLGQYVPILSAIDEFKDALQDRDIQAAFIPGVSVMLPVAVGVVVGVAAVGNLLKWLLEKHRQPTLGFLLGLLVGSTAGLFPYQQSRPPRLGEVIKGQVVTTATIDDLDAEDWPTEFYTPGAFDLLSSAGLIFVGFGITVAIARLGGRGNSSFTSTERP